MARVLPRVGARGPRRRPAVDVAILDEPWTSFFGSVQFDVLHSASPPQMLNEVFHRLIRDLKEAAACIEAKNVIGKSKTIGHAIDRVGALASSLDFDVAPELCQNLEQLYAFVQERLLAASAQMQVAPLQQAEGVIVYLRDAFAEAAAQP